MRTYIMICTSINAFLGSRAFASRQYARGCGYVLTAPAIWGRLRAYASARGAIAQRAIRPLVRGYSLALHTPRLLRLCAHRPRDWGAVARIRLRTDVPRPQFCDRFVIQTRAFPSFSLQYPPTLCATIAHSAPNSRRRHGTLYRSKQLGV